MVKHIVMWRLKDQAQGNSRSANAELVKEKLEALEGRIPGLLKVEVGLDFSATESSADVVLYTELESREALEAYQVHPEHEAVKAFIGEVTAERWVVDYEV
ncbi:stress responsive protein [Thiohalorhabdus denitrificans]|uniref:Stress responsive A/B Barrel Domain n=1 Tax=Thiohalorhabdus denitrificans TaxID=381306 RepID=A0A0N8PNM3_9GAMM|nr:Dabb family protein [Thiohalorhabdus denitrificans]KPV41925.1 stress responsive protein [Thiohalorhabdus denitrificans]SCY66552.1 Stress responsive A/B Barrel Domain [Thiohalorhabdus denitrificans]